METGKRKSEVKDAVAGGSQKRAREEEEEEETTVTDEEVEEFFAILRRIHVAVDYFKKGKGGLRDLTDLRRVELLNPGGNDEGNGGEKKAENMEENANAGLDLNADPNTSSDQSPEALWVRLLREKYKIQEFIPTSISRRSCSPLWRALSGSWEALLSNLAWTLGNGESVNFFSDIWVPALGPLSDYSKIPASAMSQISFASVLNEHGEWDVAKLSEVFTVNAVPYILGIKPPDTQSGPDINVGTSVEAHMKSPGSAADTLFFMDYLQYWRRIVPQTLLNTFFSSSVQGWLRQNLHSNIMFRTNLPWKLVFSSILWHTWKNRNDAVFNGSSSTFEQVLSRGIAWANYYNDGWLKGALVSHPTTTLTPWSNLEPASVNFGTELGSLISPGHRDLVI
ncbi:hypothetical protein V6N12_043650 [Hibiscus sabdariffa]|uniref:Uncharacterized protein n=1 Tax=Hibiscus sabdariffa TaxID=183260 RepID=A0ABR2DFX6_9ROSI